MATTTGNRASLRDLEVADEFTHRHIGPDAGDTERMLDVVGATPQAIEKHLEFAAEVTQSPLLIDGTTVEVRLAGLEYVAKAGLADRIVYNSIQPGIDDEELAAIRKAGVQSAILLTYYLQDFTGNVIRLHESPG